jgi:acyl-CoA reductase-like NAD-dependent aldehyde dehydrogenase
MPKTTARPMIKIHNTETNEVIDREMNDDEFQQYQADQAAHAAAQAQAEAKATERAALLARLGLTEDELKTILG